MLVTKMNITFDLSSQNMYTLTEDTIEMVETLTDNITIYYMVQPGNETEMFEKIAEKYDVLSDKITLVNKDPVLYPQFAAKYVEDEIAENSFIVVNQTNNRAKYIDGYEMLVQELNYETYESETTGIDVEGKLTSAIQYVTTSELPVMYVVEGHGELEIGEAFKASMDKMNITVETLSTLTQSSIPEDCDILYINAPEKDLSEEEAAMIKDYLTAGGKAIINLDYAAKGLDNFLSIIEYYGVELVNGMIMEGDSNMHLTNNPHFLVPSLENHDITNQTSDKQIPVIMPISSGLQISDTLRSSLTVEGLLSTSDSAYSKIADQVTTTEKEAGDIDGPFYLGIAATDTFNGVTSTVVVYSSESVFDEATATYGNANILTGTIGYLSGDMETLSIPTKSVEANYIYTTEQQAIIWGIVVALFIPSIILITGIVVSLKRRKK
jgi:ABC-2 type transport system permease protein